MGVRNNQIGPLNGPLCYRSGVPYPGHKNIVDKGYVDFLVKRMDRQIFRVPDAVVDLGTGIYTMPEPFQTGTAELRRNGLGENPVNITELDNLRVQITPAPANSGVAQIHVHYLPFWNAGQLSARKKAVIKLSADTLLSKEMVYWGLIHGDTSSQEVDITLPTLTALENGSTVIIAREGANQLNILTEGSELIHNTSSLVLGANHDSVELVYIHQLTKWLVTGRKDF